MIKTALVEGTLADCRLGFRCLLIGSSVFNDDFMSRVYADDAVIVRRWLVPFFLLRLFVSKSRNGFDLCVASLPSSRNILGSIAAFEGQTYVTQVIDTSGGWQGVRDNLSRSRRTQVNGLEKRHDLMMRLSTDENELESFYRDMYLPYTRERFGSLAVIHGYSHIRSVFQDNGLLFLVQADGNPVAAALCQHKNGKLIFNCAGISAGREAMLKQGALAAIFYFQIKYAVDNEIAVLDLQQSRPFLKDGVFGNKARWGAFAHPCSDHEKTTVSYVIGEMSANDSIAHVFEDWPIVVRGNSGLRAVLGYTKKADPDERDLRASLSPYLLAGLSDAVVITRNGQRSVSL